MAKAKEIAAGVFQFERLDPSGWPVAMLAARLPDRGLLLYSPTWLGEGTFEAVEALGEPRVLVAPNHYHHLSLGRFRERYPGALAVCSGEARPRLEGQGHEGLRPLAEAGALLPSGGRFLLPEGLATGEAWLSLPGERGPTWLVCDAFFNVERPVKGATGLVLRMLHTVPGPCVGDTFRWLAARDARAYAAWAERELLSAEPALLVPCHGEPLGDGGAARAHERLLLLNRLRLG